ncbi:MAG: uracil-DNA glycosylase family protein [Streptosporangiaceae bacterium]
MFGEGPVDAALAGVGETPGDQEDKHGRPFVGPAGRLRLKQTLAVAEVDPWARLGGGRPGSRDGRAIGRGFGLVKGVRAWRLSVGQLLGEGRWHAIFGFTPT